MTTRHTTTINAAPRASRPATLAGQPITSWGGAVVLVKYQTDVLVPAGGEPPILCERYAEITGIGATEFLVQWAGDPEPDHLHGFHRETGTCIESRAGIMRGYQIAPWEMDRLRGLPPGTPKAN